MKKFYIFLIFSAISLTLFGQSDIVTAGGTATGARGSATYTVGQIAVQCSAPPTAPSTSSKVCNSPTKSRAWG